MQPNTATSTGHQSSKTIKPRAFAAAQGAHTGHCSASPHVPCKQLLAGRLYVMRTAYTAVHRASCQGAVHLEWGVVAVALKARQPADDLPGAAESTPCGFYQVGIVPAMKQLGVCRSVSSAGSRCEHDQYRVASETVNVAAKCLQYPLRPKHQRWMRCVIDTKVQ